MMLTSKKSKGWWCCKPTSVCKRKLIEDVEISIRSCHDILNQFFIWWRWKSSNMQFLEQISYGKAFMHEILMGKLRPRDWDRCSIITVGWQRISTPKAAGQSLYNFKVIFIVSFFIPIELCSSNYCPKVISQFLKKPELWQDKAPIDSALSIYQFYAKNQMTALLQPLYSPDVGPCDFLFFPKQISVESTSFSHH